MADPWAWLRRATHPVGAYYPPTVDYPPGGPDPIAPTVAPPMATVAGPPAASTATMPRFSFTSGPGTTNPGQPNLSNARPGYVPGSDPAYEAQLAVLNSRLLGNESRQGVINAEQGVVPFRYATLASQRGVLDARGRLLPAQRGQTQANSAVVGASGRQIEGERGLITRQQGENETQRAEFNAEQAALNNTADQSAVARFKRSQAAGDAHLRSMGITPEADVTVPVGSTARLAPGTRAAATTQAEDVARTNTAARTARGFDMDAAKLVVSLLGSDVDRARNIAAQAGITVAEAQQAVNEAELAAGYAGNNESTAQVGVTQAQLGNEQANLATSSAELNSTIQDTPPFPGAVRYRDPNGGPVEWITQAEKDQRDTDYATGNSQARLARTTGGSTLAAIPQADLLNEYENPTVTVRPGGSLSSASIESELVRRLVQQGYNQEQARQAVRQMIQSELQQREAAAARANSGRPTVTVPGGQ